ncbi:hypothetical protein [Streptomyces cacaoi]|uniref:hypothetical protein n=1 Tax=Streptomyces cacaoi TaxID=1898 RepID=UPI001659330B|nr:hypothetical protein [Streptomyces cacaoi]
MSVKPVTETNVIWADVEDAPAIERSRRMPHGTELSGFITDLTLKDGRQVIKDGRWVR